MDKTYEALIERLRKSYIWHKEDVEYLEHQHDLNEYEKQSIIEHKAIASYIDTVLRVEASA